MDFFSYFNPLPPRGGRREPEFVVDVSRVISTHSLLAEGDSCAPVLSWPSKISTHSLLAEGDTSSLLAICAVA